MTTYVDSSVLLRLVLGEPDHLRAWDAIEPISSALLRVECLRAVQRYRQMGAIDDQTVAERRQAILDAVKRFRLVDVSPAVLMRAADPFPVHVATLDAIHLATALEVRAELEDIDFATHDRKLADAARSLDFDVLGV